MPLPFVMFKVAKHPWRFGRRGYVDSGEPAELIRDQRRGFGSTGPTRRDGLADYEENFGLTSCRRASHSQHPTKGRTQPNPEDPLDHVMSVRLPRVH
jgi:hypothetical protein